MCVCVCVCEGVCINLYVSKKKTSSDFYNLVNVCGSFYMIPVHILMSKQVAKAKNSFYSRGALRADSLHLVPDLSG